MIHHAPHARLSLLARRPSPAMREELAFAPGRHRFCRDALYDVFRLLAREHRSVWMPSFHCGMEVRAAVDAGLTPRYYRLRADLSVDEDDLAMRLRESPGPVLLIHYFGFAQAAASRIAAPVVEDCSHAFLSRDAGVAVGTHGVAAAFSLYKTCGTAEGGALRTALASAAPRMPLVSWDAEVAAARKRRRDARGAGIAVEHLARRFETRAAVASRRIFEGPWHYGQGISRLSLALIERMDPREIVERRRANYVRLLALVGGDPVFAALPEGCCPLYLPLFVRDRTAVMLRMQSRGVEPFLFGFFHHPTLPVDEFPEAKRMREEILCLPIHHELGERELRRVAEAMAP
jgi:dTDP-4-amino-4,6-dideoxygalactose transaminase